MTAPTLEATKIPEDVMQAALECAAQFSWKNDDRWHFFIADAIFAERERCGLVAGAVSEKWVEDGNPDLQTALGEVITGILHPLNPASATGGEA